MSSDKFTRDDLLQIRRNRAGERTEYSGDQKKYKVKKDKLSVEGRYKVNQAKDKLTYGIDDGDEW